MDYIYLFLALLAAIHIGSFAFSLRRSSGWIVFSILLGLAMAVMLLPAYRVVYKL